jgi:hypothetical protein
MYIVGSIVIVLGLLTYGAFTFFTKAVPYLNSIATPAFNRNGDANTNLYVEGPFVREYAAAAVMELPPAPQQRDSPSVQLGFFGTSGGIQGGLIRTPGNKFRLRAFVAYGTAAGQNRIRYFDRLNEGPHAVEIRVHDGKLMFFVDGRHLFEVPQSAYVPPGTNPWLALGTAVKYRHARAYGTISDIRVRRDTDVALLSYQPVCIVSNGGISIRPVRDHWVIGGWYLGNVPPTYEHCRATFERHGEIANNMN